VNPLNNPIWHALNTRQRHFAEGDLAAKRFPPAVTTLAGLPEETSTSFAALARLLSADETAALFLDQVPDDPKDLAIVEVGPLLQMIHDGSPQGLEPVNYVALGDDDIPAMMTLAELTKPGPFGKRTRELGSFFGIYQGDRLVAMAGERLHLDGYTEVTAVCTHPDFAGKGFARALVKIVMGAISKRGEVPFLHVRPNNIRAVALYEKLGFKATKSNHLVVVRRQS
jgi:ribosomal protein S18 acetylase RimI-like enzyme